MDVTNGSAVDTGRSRAFSLAASATTCHVFPHRRFFIFRPLVVVAAAGLVYCSDGPQSGETHFTWTFRGTASAQTRPAKPNRSKAAPTNENLPRNTAETRDAILAAIATGRIDELRGAFELNEMPPDVGQGPGEDALAYLKSLSTSAPPPPQPPVTAEPKAPATPPGGASAAGAAGSVALPSPANPVDVNAPAAGDGRDILEAIGMILKLPPTVIPAGRDFENNGIYVWPYLAELDLSKLRDSEAADLAALVGAEAAAKMITSKRWTYWRIAIGADGTWHSLSLALQP